MRCIRQQAENILTKKSNYINKTIHIYQHN